MTFLDYLLEGDTHTDSETMTEGLDFTNVRTFKQFFTDKRKTAAKLTKEANSEFKKENYKSAKALYQKALPIWKDIFKNISKVPEAQPGKISGSNINLVLGPYVWLPLQLTLLYSHVSTIKYVPKATLNADDVRKKVSQMTKTGSITKSVILNAIGAVIDYIEFQIKACEKPDGIVLESVDSSEIDSLIESLTIELEGGRNNFASTMENADLVNCIINSVK